MPFLGDGSDELLRSKSSRELGSGWTTPRHPGRACRCRERLAGRTAGAIDRATNRTDAPSIS